jgi:1-pyrroline-5-carboxylate dehydrogenase
LPLNPGDAPAPVMTDTALPRVTYSNIRADLSGVHELLDRCIPTFRQVMPGKTWPNRIGGADDTGGERYDALSPIDRRITLGTFHAADAAAIDRAVTAARRAYPAWSRTPWAERVGALRRLADELDRRKYDLAVACLMEVGKSRMEAMGEAEEAVDLARYYADEMEANAGFARPLERAFAQEQTGDVLRPVGAFAVIAPFNFPLALSVNMMSGALLAGNTVIYKPSPFAGLTGALLIEAVEAAGLTGGVVNLVCGGAASGEALVRHPGIDGFAFTGSHRVGMGILRTVAAGSYNRPVIVEMGGKNPTYVTASADLDVAAEGVMRSAFGLQGQKCSAGSKVYVHAAVKNAFLHRLLALTAKIKIGDPRARDVFMGPLIDDHALARFRDAAGDAQRDGKVLAGGTVLAGGAYDQGPYVAPTVVDGLDPGHRINKEELFLPLLSVLSFTDLAAAIADGNDVIYGLTAGCYAQDGAELDLFLERAEAGVLYANRASGATTGAWPGIQSFCGWKGSGVTSKGGLGPYYLSQFMREQSRTVWRGGQQNL